MKTIGITMLLGGLLIGTPAAAQNANTDKRVERLEQEMRAIQRKVFAGGSTRYFEPEITAETGPAPSGTTNTTSAVTDLIARVDALERSLANLTGQVEENGFRLKKIEDRLAAAPVPAPAVSTGVPAKTPAAKAEPEAAPDPERVIGVAAIVMPDTGDAAEDAYIYGYRLWEAKYYPEAQAQLKKMVEEHSSHRRASFAQNLLGRAYLDDNKPALASVALYENYQKRPRGERAPDSLYFLSTALVQLKKKPDACRVLAELQDVYPDVASGRLASQITAGKAAASCK